MGDPFDTSDFESEGLLWFYPTIFFVYTITSVFTPCLAESSHSEGISIPGCQPIRSDDDSALAKSLPMRVPAMSFRSQDIDIEDDKVFDVIINLTINSVSDWRFLYLVKTPMNPEEMEASIKAMARSVHNGSDSYWDLPRPRLNTLHWWTTRNSQSWFASKSRSLFFNGSVPTSIFLLQLSICVIFLVSYNEVRTFKICPLGSFKIVSFISCLRELRSSCWIHTSVYNIFLPILFESTNIVFEILCSCAAW